MVCHHDGCSKASEPDRSECFRHRILGVGFSLKGSALVGSENWNSTASDWKREHLGTADDRELGKRGIERS